MTAITTARHAAAHLAELLRAEHHAMAAFLLALAEFDRRRGWLDLGYTGLFHFLHRDLGLSKGAAHYRKTAAALLQRVPEVVAPLRDGRLCLSSIVEAARVVTPENHAAVLPRFFGLSAREAREVTAALCPVADPPRRELVTALPRPLTAEAQRVLTSEPVETGAQQDAPAHPVPTAELVGPPVASPAPASFAVPLMIPLPAPAPPRASSEPLTAELARLHLTVTRRFLAKLETARHARSHVKPDASAEAILEEALDLLLERAARRRGQTRRRKAISEAASKGETLPAQRLALSADEVRTGSPVSAYVPAYVPANVRAAVWTRDGGRCQWPLAPGAICGSTWQPELDHLHPRARGGPSTVANVRVLCRFHNALAARQAYGDAWMDRFTRTAVPRPRP